ncbi:MAG: steryl acetyl hydrolase [Pseudomonadales bacterium]|nr:MAG: steryl acetyl hydrolase [Pseudomonadales bacterium]
MSISSGPESVEPKIPVSSDVSEAWQAVLAMPIQFDRSDTPNTPEEWAAARKIAEELYGPMLQAASAETGASVKAIEIAGVNAYEVLPATPATAVPEQVVIFVHGGAYTILGGELSVCESPLIAQKGNYRVIAVDYRMPPEHPFPAAIDDVVAVYEALLKDYEASGIALMGSSAGAGLAAASVLASRDAGLPLPGAVVMHTPWTDISKTGDSYYINDCIDPTLPTYEGRLEASAKVYANGRDLKDPLLSPVYADFSKGFSPTFIQSGTRDLLLSCAVRTHRALCRANVPADLHVYEGMGHGIPPVFPDYQELLADTDAFLKKHLKS